IAYFLRRPDMAHDAKRERLASLVERAGALTCPCGGGPGHGDAWCGDYECPTCGRGPELDEAIFQAGVERGRADMAPAEAAEASDESARCTCEWMSPEDGSVHARWPAVLDAR